MGTTLLNGKLYGQTLLGGANDDGTIYRLTNSGKFKVLHNFDQTVDDAAVPNFPLSVGGDGNLYGASQDWHSGFGPESLYESTVKGKYTDLYNGFSNPDDCPVPAACLVSSPLLFHSNGTIYGTTAHGGQYQRGVFYAFQTSGKAYVRPELPLAKVGTTIGILGQGFKNATAVSFNGTAAKFEVSSDTYLRATVPAGATMGPVTVTMTTGRLSSNIDFSPEH